MDYLPYRFVTHKSQPGSTHFIASLNVGWLKLKKYYEITDLNPAYITAVFPSPHYRHILFEDNWAATPAFVEFARTTVDKQYAAAKRSYNIDAPERSSTSPPARRKELTGYAAYNRKTLSR
jgi:hypothetical protein